jgi:PAS domain S-box-containing protein
MTTISGDINETDRLMSSVGVGMWTWDGGNMRLSLDPTCKGFFELDWDQDTPQTVLEEKIPPADIEKYRQAVEDCKDTGKFACEFKVKRSAGGYRYLSGRGHTVKQKDDTFFINGVFIDVTATKQLEGRLKATQSRMQQLIDGIPGLFSYIDTEYRVWFMSSQYRDIFSRSADELVGVHIKDLIGEEVFNERKPRYDAALAGEEVHSESSRSMLDGSVVHFAVTHKPYRDGNGQTLGVLTLGIDITDRRDIECQVEAQTEELKRSNKDLEQFAYVASHDLKAPLRAIDVIVEWLREDLDGYSEGDVQENLTLLEQRTGRLGCLLDDLLAFSRAGRKVGDVKHLHLDEFVKDIATLIGPPEGMQINTSEGWPCLTTHHAALETVLRNLINNAIKHHPEPASGHITVSCEDQDDKVMISVEDDGVGIPQDYADKVFKMFQTLKPRDDTEGSGMGLAIVQRIIDWQGGKIWFEDTASGKGVVFRFTWNKSPQDMPSVDDAATADGGSIKAEHDHSHEHSHEHGDCAGHDKVISEKLSTEEKDDENERAKHETCEDTAG